MANHRQASHAHIPYTACNFENAPVTIQSPVSSERRPRPAGRLHYVVISRDECKLVTRVRVMLPWQRNPCPDCKSAQQCTTRGQPLPCPKLHPGPCSSVGARPQTDRHTDACDHNTFCVVYDSRKMTSYLPPFNLGWGDASLTKLFHSMSHSSSL